MKNVKKTPSRHISELLKTSNIEKILKTDMYKGTKIGTKSDFFLKTMQAKKKKNHTHKGVTL